MRYILLTFILALVLAVEGMAESLPYIGFLAPDFALLFVTAYSMRGSGEDFWILCFAAGVVKGSVSPEPAGFYILAYLVITAVVLRTRGLLFINYATTQMVVLFLSGCFLLSSHLVLSATGLLPGAGAGGILGRIASCVVTAFLAPLAVEVYDRSRTIRTLLNP